MFYLKTGILVILKNQAKKMLLNANRNNNNYLTKFNWIAGFLKKKEGLKLACNNDLLIQQYWQ